MTPKKKFEYSKYQKDIFDFVENGKGNAVIEACAGAGKTTVLVNCLNLIDENESILMCAFNKDISTELKKKTKKFKNVNCMTLHSLGYKILLKEYPYDIKGVDEFKYKSYINANLKSLSSINTFSLSKSEFFRYVDNINKYVEFGRCYLITSLKELDFIEERYQIETIADEKEIALNVIEWGKGEISTVDYTDMIYLPNILKCRTDDFLYDWIMVDEAQDLSIAQREIILKCRKENTRMLFVGDREQCIYSFSSSDPESFDKLKLLPNTISLPLSISYRCARNIVDFAKSIVPTIEDSGDGRQGEVVHDCQLMDVADGDMILCRNNAPLMQAYVKLISEGKKCFIRGKDVGMNMTSIIKRTKMEELNVDLIHDGVFVRLYDGLFNLINEVSARHNISYNDAIESSDVSTRLDMIMALEILSEGLNTSDELIERIKSIFSDKKMDGIALSTVHKAKGLESDNVFIICPSLMPSTKAKKAWEIRQEYNLMYVAYTRAKNKLCFVSESEFKPFSVKTSELANILKNKERIVNLVLKRERRKVDTTNKFVVNDIIRNATKIEMPQATQIEKIKDARNNSTMDLSDFFAERRKIMDKKKHYR
jgi:superfamily I DNA/RNA helicase